MRERYDCLYSPRQLQPRVTRTEQIASQAQDTYVVTNNHNSGKAGVNALQMKAMLEHEKVPAPPTLLATYPALPAPTHCPASKRLPGAPCCSQRKTLARGAVLTGSGIREWSGCRGVA